MFKRTQVHHECPGLHLCSTSVLGGLVAALLGTGALAQERGLPGANAGILQRQQDVAQQEEFQEQPGDAGVVILPQATVDAIAASPVDRGGPSLYLSEWRFQGNTLIDTPELRRVLGDYTRRELSFSQVDKAARMIEAYYGEKGYVAAVTLPPQEVVGGVVTLDVQEARYAGVVFEGDPPRRVRPQMIERVFDSHVKSGAPLRPKELDRPLLVANAYAGVNMSASLTPGINPGESVLLLNTSDEKPLVAQVTIDNFGARSIGHWRGSAQLGVNSPLGLGDSLLTRVSLTEGSPDAQLRYTLPVGGLGTNLWVEAGYMHYDVVTSEFDALDPDGRSVTRSAGISIPLLLDRNLQLDGFASYGRSDFRNRVSHSTVSNYHVNKATFGLIGSWIDNFAGGGVSNFALSYSRGKASGRELSAQFSDHFNVWRLSIDREQNLTQRMTLFGSVAAQKGSHGLDSSEEFFLGGPYGVRAYPLGEGSGPSGVLLNVELRRSFGDGWELAGFYDQGWIADRDVEGERSHYHLKGVGLRVSWDSPTGWGADLTASHRLGSNPNSIDDSLRESRHGKDQDGSLEKLRLWFDLRKNF